MAASGFQFNTNNQVGGPINRGEFIPTSIISKDLISDTSEAYECFVYQKFSAKLQAFMINYVITTSSMYSVYS